MSERLIIIDGYNVIHRTPALRPGPDRTLQQARDKLLNLLAWAFGSGDVGSSRVDLQACKLEYSIVSPK